jgi:hypothetical protein
LTERAAISCPDFQSRLRLDRDGRAAENESRTLVTLPPRVRSLFWEHGDRDISAEEHPDFVIDRVLSSGDWQSSRWLRQQVGDAAIRERVTRTHGRHLDPRQLRLWQVLLDLPEAEVTRWLDRDERRLWDRRAG